MHLSAALSILAFGRDTRLLQTRQWVLESAGFRVLAVRELGGVCELVVSQSFDLLLLCHSVTSAERHEAIAAAQSAQPNMRYLSMTKQTPLQAVRQRDATISCFEGPGALIAAINRLFASGYRA